MRAHQIHNRGLNEYIFVGVNQGLQGNRMCQGYAADFDELYCVTCEGMSGFSPLCLCESD
ncbi:hypothetical protein JCM14469_23650 [Desulfatiferula olefinivorans]